MNIFINKFCVLYFYVKVRLTLSLYAYLKAYNFHILLANIRVAVTKMLIQRESNFIFIRYARKFMTNSSLYFLVKNKLVSGITISYGFFATSEVQ